MFSVRTAVGNKILLNSWAMLASLVGAENAKKLEPALLLKMRIVVEEHAGIVEILCW
jgi:hypothetical protein